MNGLSPEVQMKALDFLIQQEKLRAVCKACPDYSVGLIICAIAGVCIGLFMGYLKWD